MKEKLNQYLPNSVFDSPKINDFSQQILNGMAGAIDKESEIEDDQFDIAFKSYKDDIKPIRKWRKNRLEKRKSNMVRLNENLFVEYSYKDRVSSDLKRVIMDIRGISEKSFSLLDELDIEIDDFCTEDIENIINDFEIKKYRSKFCAEFLYNKFFSE